MTEHDPDLRAVVQEVWDNDINRLRPGTDYRISLQVIIIIIITISPRLQPEVKRERLCFISSVCVFNYYVLTDIEKKSLLETL